MTAMVRSYDVEPGLGIPPVRLGMTRAQSRASIGAAFETYEKVAGSGVFVDAYFESTFQVFFEPDTDVVDTIEICRDPELLVRLQDVDLLNSPASTVIEAVSILGPLDEGAPESGYVFSFPSLGLSLWRPDDTQEFFETVDLTMPS